MLSIAWGSHMPAVRLVLTFGESLCRLAEQRHQEEQLREKDKHKTDALLRQAQLEEAERHRKANEALQRAECVRQRRLVKVSASSRPSHSAAMTRH